VCRDVVRARGSSLALDGLWLGRRCPRKAGPGTRGPVAAL
jgi:hypothetical protein